MSLHMKTLKPKWTIVVDNREQLPYTFENLTIGTGKSMKTLALSVVSGTLPTGDYSILGMENRVAIERKTPEDLFNTLVRGRDRFIRELARLNELEFAAVLVEAEWQDLMMNPPERSRLAPVSFDGMMTAFMIRYPKVHWMFRPGRFASSKVCYKTLNRFWEEKHDCQ